MQPENLIAITHVSRRVAAMTGQRPGPSPRKIYDLALREAFPATFVNGRWYVDERDVPLVATALGIRTAEKTAA